MKNERQKIEVPQDNYGRVYIGMLETSMSAYAKLCYGVMWSFGSESWASVASVARRMSVSKNTVRKSQTELRNKGWIILKDEVVGETKTWQMVPASPLHHVNPPPSPRGGVPLHHVNPNKEDKQEGKQELLRERVPAKKKKADQYTEDFEQAWGMYDKGSKFEAFGHWQKLGTSGPDADLFLKILESIEWQSKTEDWQKEGGKFRKDFCRWLKYKGWEISKPKDFKPAIIPGQRKTIDGVQL